MRSSLFPPFTRIAKPFAVAMLALSAAAPAQNSGLDWLRFVGGPGIDAAGFPNGLHMTDLGNIWIGGGDGMTAPARATIHHLTGGGATISTFALGSSGISRANAVKTDPSGAVVYVAGHTTDQGFPVTATAVQSSLQGPRDMFAAILDANTGTVLYATYLGGSGDDVAADLELDAQGRVWVYGVSDSANFPTTTNAYQPGLGGGNDLVLACIDPMQAGLAGLLYSTYFGTSGNEPAGNPSDLYLEPNGVLTFLADTDSGTLPTTPGAFQPNFGGGPADAFVARLDPSRPPASQLVYCTYFGGSGFENGNAMATNGYLVTLGGFTDSSDLPTNTAGLPPAVQTAKSTVLDAFFAQLDLVATGPAQLRYCTYLGGTNNDGTNSLSVDAAGNVTMCGVTGSSGLATQGALQTTVALPSSAFVATIDPVVGRLLYCSYLGHPSGATGGTLVRSDGQGGVVAVGNTTASGLPITLGPPLAGMRDQFIARWNLLPDGAARCGQSTPSSLGVLSQFGVTSQPRAGNAAFSFLAGGAPEHSCLPTIGFLMASFAPCAALPVPPFGTFWLVPPWLMVSVVHLNGGEARAEFPLSLVGLPVGGFAAFECVWLEPCPAALSATPAVEITIR